MMIQKRWCQSLYHYIIFCHYTVTIFSGVWQFGATTCILPNWPTDRVHIYRYSCTCVTDDTPACWPKKIHWLGQDLLINKITSFHPLGTTLYNLLKNHSTGLPVQSTITIQLNDLPVHVQNWCFVIQSVTWGQIHELSVYGTMQDTWMFMQDLTLHKTQKKEFYKIKISNCMKSGRPVVPTWRSAPSFGVIHLSEMCLCFAGLENMETIFLKKYRNVWSWTSCEFEWWLY
jgi:hypothetical protein